VRRTSTLSCTQRVWRFGFGVGVTSRGRFGSSRLGRPPSAPNIRLFQGFGVSGFQGFGVSGFWGFEVGELVMQAWCGEDVQGDVRQACSDLRALSGASG
jgi:hypothetical protein